MLCIIIKQNQTKRKEKQTSIKRTAISIDDHYFRMRFS